MVSLTSLTGTELESHLNECGAVIAKSPVFLPIVQAFEDAAKAYPDSVLGDELESAEFDLTEVDRAAIWCLSDNLEQWLCNLVPGSIVKFHFVGYAANKDIQPWHNDYSSGFAGHNATLNVFYDTNKDAEGLFEMSKDDQLRGCFMPAAGDMIIFNQSPEWKHRVTPSKKLRRVISFACLIPTIF